MQLKQEIAAGINVKNAAMGGHFQRDKLGSRLGARRSFLKVLEGRPLFDFWEFVLDALPEFPKANGGEARKGIKLDATNNFDHGWPFVVR